MKLFSLVRAASQRALSLLRRSPLTKPAIAMLSAAAALSVPSLAFAAEAATKNAEVSWWQAIILGLVQGLTEFIPVSSSAHLNITHAFMGQGRDLTYDVFLSIGTVVALAYYFRHDWKEIFTNPKQSKLRNLVFVSCIPAVILAVFVEKLQEKSPLFADPRANAFMLIFAGAVLLLADKIGKQNRDIESTTLKDALLVGTAQAIALIPGVSRSGSTLTMGLFLGLKRSDAARFSFLMSLPISIGAVLYQGRHLVTQGFASVNASPLAMLLGILASAISGFWAIGFLLNYLKTKDVTPFFIWRVVVALFVFASFRS